MGEKDSALTLAEHAIVLLPRAKDAMDGPGFEENLALIQTIFGKNDRAISTLTQLLQTPYIVAGFTAPLRRHFLGSIRSGIPCAAIPLSKNSARKSSREPARFRLTAEFQQANDLDCRHASRRQLMCRVSHQDNIRQMCIRAFDPRIARKPDDAASNRTHPRGSRHSLTQSSKKSSFSSWASLEGYFSGSQGRRWRWPPASIPGFKKRTSEHTETPPGQIAVTTLDDPLWLLWMKACSIRRLTSRGFRFGPSSQAISSNERRGMGSSPMIRRAIVLLPAPALPRRISFIAQTWTKTNEKEISHGRVSWQTRS